MKLYRAVSDEEWADIQAFGGFRSIPSSMQGHWFAELAVDAFAWGQKFPAAAGQPFAVLEVDVPDQIVHLLFYLPKLDNIGPARFADDVQLGIINQAKTGSIRLIAAGPTRSP